MDAMHNHMWYLLYPFVALCICTLGWGARWIVSRVLKSNEQLGVKVDNLAARVDAKLDLKDFKETIGRAFGRIEEMEQTNHDIAERVLKLELKRETEEATQQHHAHHVEEHEKGFWAHLKDIFLREREHNC